MFHANPSTGISECYIFQNIWKLYPGQSICPYPCQCLSSYSQLISSCDHLNLTSVPAGLDTNTQVLNLSSNNMMELKEKMFASYGLYSMRKLVLSNCSLDKVDQQAFLELFSLEDLDLSTNFLMEVPSRSFANIPNLISLNLKKNPIKIIRFLDFVIFPHLKILDLSSCEISFISRHAFTGLFNLQQLSLNGNQLKTLKTEPNFPSSLQILNLGSNPWHCDCNLNLLRNLLLVSAEIQAKWKR